MHEPETDQIHRVRGLDRQYPDAYFHLLSHRAGDGEMFRTISPRGEERTEPGRRWLTTSTNQKAPHLSGARTTTLLHRDRTTHKFTHSLTILRFSLQSAVKSKRFSSSSLTKCSHTEQPRREWHDDGSKENQDTCHGGEQPQSNRRHWGRWRWRRRDLEVN